MSKGQNDRSRKVWRVAFCILGVCALAVFIKEICSGVHLLQLKNTIDASVSIIGGADGPTAIFVSGLVMRKTALFLSAAGIVTAVIGIWHTRRK